MMTVDDDYDAVDNGRLRSPVDVTLMVRSGSGYVTTAVSNVAALHPPCIMIDQTCRDVT